MKRLQGKPNLNTLAFWERNYFGKTSWRYEPYVDFLNYNKNNKFFENNKFSLLDFGCGLCDGLMYIQEYYHKSKYYGMDFSSNARKGFMTRGKGNIKFILDDIYDCIFTNKYIGEFEYIIIIQTLEHIENPIEVVKYLFERCIKKLFISVPNPNHPLAHDREHITIFNTESFNNVNGLKEYISDAVLTSDVRLNFVFDRNIR